MSVSSDLAVVPSAPTEVTRSEKAAATAHIVSRLATTSGHVVWEKLRRSDAVVAGDVPVSADNITPQWLTAVLCGGHPGAEVLSFDVPGGSSGTSTRSALHLTYNAAGQAAGLPVDLYTKTTTSLTQRLILGMAGIIEGEIDFFNRVRPRVDIETPHGYHSAVDLRSWRSISLLENITVTRGATFLHSDKTFSRQAVEDLLGDLATLHGTMWQDRDVERADSFMRTPLDLLHSIKSSINMRKRSAIGAERAKAVIPASLMPRLDELWFAFERSMAAATQGPKTFLHGDAHVGNTYVTRAGRTGYTDWQLCMRGSWAFDVALCISSTLQVEDRRAWERELLAFYLERLERAGGQAPELDAAWTAYRVQILYPYHSWTYTIGRGPLQPKMQPDRLCLPIIERTATAIADHGSIELATR
jgi:thiamine kinase-like enzyme